jgi:hypothetical protein
VEIFTQNGQELSLTDATRWKTVSIQQPRNLGIRMMDASTKYYEADYDAAKNTMALCEGAHKSHTNLLAYAWPDAEHVVPQ